MKPILGYIETDQKLKVINWVVINENLLNVYRAKRKLPSNLGSTGSNESISIALELNKKLDIKKNENSAPY